MHTERARHNCERRASLVLCCGHGNGLVGHLADRATPGDAGLREVVHHGGSVDLVALGEPVDRVAESVLMDHLFNLCVGKSVLHRV